MGVTYLNCPFNDKDEAKALGAKWDSVKKRWYVPDGCNLSVFAKWLPKENDFKQAATPVINELTRTGHYNLDEKKFFGSCFLYLVIGRRECFRCHNQTEVVGFGIPYDSHAGFEDGCPIADCVHPDSLAIVSELQNYPRVIMDYIERRCGFKYIYSKTTQSHYWANTCTTCGVLQGQHYLFCEPDSPFCAFTKDDFSALDFIRVDCGGLRGPISMYSNADGITFEWALGHEQAHSMKVRECVYV